MIESSYYIYTKEEWKKITDKEELKDTLSYTVDEIQQKLSIKFNREIKGYWTRKDTFCFVFSEYDTKNKQWVLGKGETFFAELSKGRYYCALLSDNMEENFEEFILDGKKCIRVNSKNYREFTSKFNEPKDLVSIFLYEFESPMIAKVIRNWIRGFETPGVVTVPILDLKKIIESLPHEDIGSIEKLEEFASLLKSTDMSIIKNHNFFEKQLEKFLSHIGSDSSEKDLRDFLLDNLWILDFKYFGYEEPTKEEKTDVGNMDIFVSKNSFGTNHLSVIELKKSDKPLATTSDRGEKKPNLRSEVIRALSQAIHYIENIPRQPYSTVEGFVIIGIRDEKSGKILDALNARLHGIKIVTYDDLYRNTKIILDSFKQKKMR